MTKYTTAVKDELLCLDEVCNVSTIIQSSTVISGASLPPRSTIYKEILQLLTFYKDIECPDAALNHRHHPANVVELPKLFGNIRIPAEFELTRISLCPSNTGETQVVCVTEIEALLEDPFLQKIQIFLNFLSFFIPFK